jgi:hypothetical protein
MPSTRRNPPSTRTSLMKKPSASKAALSVKKKPTAISVKKKPAASKAATALRSRQRSAEWRSAALRSAELETATRKRQNVKARSRKAAKKSVPYIPRGADLLKVAVQARAAQMMAKAAITVAQRADTKSDQAGREAREAKSESREAKSESVAAYQQLLQMERRLGCVETDVKKTQALAKHNHERLNTDDRKEGFSTPRRASKLQASKHIDER